MSNVTFPLTEAQSAKVKEILTPYLTGEKEFSQDDWIGIDEYYDLNLWEDEFWRHATIYLVDDNGLIQTDDWMEISLDHILPIV
jgi:hypothetical protein